uniref:Uncharacterized protein n=1 Tax=viral metagenome TaxID=1070528 RepID=A0A6C0E3U3_9ZZZZ
MENDKYLKEYMHRFTLSSVSLLMLLQQVNERDTNETKSKERFMNTSSKLVTSMKNADDDYDYTKMIKKSFGILKDNKFSKLLKEKSYELFNLRNDDKQIITLIDGIDLRVGYKLMTEEELTNFWQYVYLYCSSVLNIIKINNVEKFTKYTKVIDTLAYIEEDIKKTGIMVANKLFNPFLGLLKDNGEYSLESLINQTTNQSGANIKDGVGGESQTLDFMMNMIGINKIVDEDKLKEGLKDLGEEQISEATNLLTQILGVDDDQEINGVCSDLLGGLVSGLKTDGLNKKTAETVFEKAKGIDKKHMEKMGKGIMNFLSDGEEKLKSMKDKKGNKIINDDVLENMQQPLAMLKTMMGNKGTGGAGGAGGADIGAMMSGLMGMMKNMTPNSMNNLD